ncbi:cupin domain-containing protein [Aspergillus lucknowensis]|uniref:Cupin type-1 domain-containing protein n=1 Tax=Aspergillus lucknowensis TaxID=176173 RepID=A0ABR4LFP3_9EURO
MAAQPEIYFCEPTRYVPNSQLPVLVYRDVLSKPYDEETIQTQLEGNRWLKGGIWGAIPRHHFHPNTHECYAVFQGSSTLLIGAGPLDDIDKGQTIHVKVGDVIILPAGVSHCSKDFEGDYRYMGVYPEGAPKWKNEYCKDESRYQSIKEEAGAVPVPEWDPVGGYHGPLWTLWNRATA